MKYSRTIIAAVLALLVGISLSAYAGPQQNFEKAHVYLQKARATTAVQVKNENLKNAKEQILQSKYTKGGHGAAAVALIMQAIKYVNEFKLEMANGMIDGASVKVKHAIQAIKQEATVKAKTDGK
jgi:hypothetical protein